MPLSTLRPFFLGWCCSLLVIGCVTGGDLPQEGEQESGTSPRVENAPSERGTDFWGEVPEEKPEPTDPVAGSGSCSPGFSEKRACGACDSGMQTRHCSDQGAWLAYGICTGANAGYPVHPATGKAVCPPYQKPAVFFAPHPDDETLGMGAAIREHVLSGRSVFVELMTQGKASGVRTTLANGATHDWHGGSHVYPLEPDAFGAARVKEFLDATARLGVAGVFIHDYADGALGSMDVTRRAAWWTSQGFPGLSLKGTAGPQDPVTVGGAPHRDHVAVYEGLMNSGATDLRFYGISVYRTQETGGFRIKDTGPFCDAKKNALGAYKTWQPGSGRYAIGYHSTPEIWEASHSNCTEYVLFH